MEILGTTVEAVNTFNKYIFTPVMNQLGYLCSYRQNIQSLSNQVEQLNKKKLDLEQEVLAARRRTRNIASNVTDWIEKVEKIIEMKEEIMKGEAQAQKGCFYGIFPNIKSKYSLSKKAKNAAEVARVLLQNEMNIISHHAPLVPIPLPSSITEIDSRKSKENQIMEALNDNSIYVIALCGMAGVGKTSMAMKIKNRVEEGKIFEIVAMTVVSQTLDLKKVQQGIAEAIGLIPLEEQDISTRAQRLHMRLKDTKSILIILDDVWEQFNLQDIGIPPKGMHQRCKIILTSRRQKVCESIEDSAKFIILDILSEQEAWNLFKEKAGEIIDKEKLHPIAREVAKECKGLPLALVTVAAALRHSSFPSWNDALHQLKASHLTDIPEVHDKVYVSLRWSYDQMRHEEARYLFLLCCLFPEDYEISLLDLVKFGFGLHIFANTFHLEEARNRVYRLVEMLLDRFLLIRVDLRIYGIDASISEHFMKYRVKIHDVIRDMGISIASKSSNNFVVIHDPNLREWPNTYFDYKNCTCVSLKSSTHITLLEKIQCPRLELLRVDSPSVTIKESSFDKMECLRVLYTNELESLPSSLSWVTNIKSLTLSGCKFKNFPSEIGEFVNLEILDLSYSYIGTLPKEIEKLKNLKLLDLICARLGNISPGSISGLVELEELYIIDLVREREVYGTIEALSLKKLRILQLEASIIEMENFHHSNENISMLKCYFVVIGMECDEMENFKNYERGIFLKLSSGKHLPRSVHLIQVLFDNAQVVILVGDGTTEIAHKLSRHGYKEVECLSLRGLGLEFLFDSVSWNHPDVSYFPCLKELHLFHNKFLKEICNGRPPNGSFSNLVSIDLYSCDVMSHLFTISIVGMLSMLESLHIAKCESIESLFVERKIHDSEEDNKTIINTITLPRLAKIQLRQLPRLGALYWSTKDLIIELPKLVKLEILVCPSLRNFRPVEDCFTPTNAHENKEK